MEQVSSFLSLLISSESWPPRWQCGAWSDFHGWLYILSDLAIALAYFVIPLILFYFRRSGPPLKLNHVVVLFGVFIPACGATHLLDAIMFWWPGYRLNAVVRFVTAVASWLTVLALTRVIPQALSMKKTSDFLERRLNAALLATKTQLEEAQRLAGVGSWSYDARTQAVKCSAEFSRIVGHAESVHTFGSHEHKTLFSPSGWERLDAAIKACLAASGGFELELDVVRPGGEHRHCTARGEAVCNEHNQVERVVGTLHDVTELKRTRLELEKVAQRTRLANRAAAIGIWEWDLGTDALIWDSTMFPMYGVARDATVNYETWRTALHPEDLLDAESSLTRAVRTGEPFDTVFRIVLPDGEIKHLRGHGRVQQDDTGVPVRVVGVNWDCTRERRAELALRDSEARLKAQRAELERSNQELEQFAYVASHDLQEPLRAVSGCSQMLQRKYAGKLDKQADELFVHVVEGAARLQTLILDLLALSRVGTHGQPLQLVDSRLALDRALANLQVAVTESHATFEVDTLPQLRADQAQLVQLFQNLLANAIKYAGSEAPKIHIGCAETAEGWQFSISDNGIGIEPQFYDRIFVLFQRLHTRVEYKGTGIGLALCKKIVERHGGRIWVQSEPGQGSVFHFTIPGGVAP